MRFSIIIVSHNQREFVQEAVDSALALRSKDAEIVVVDDGSNDGSQDILRTYGESIRFAPVEANQGASAARNYGALLARGEYLVFLDADDVFLPWALDVYARIVRDKQPKLILALLRWFHGAVPTDSNPQQPRAIQLVTYGDSLQRDRGYAASSSALVIERQSYHAIGGWALDLRHSDDQDVILRMGRSGPAVQVLSPPTILHRGHPGSLNMQVHSCVGDLCKLMRKEKNGEYPGGRARRVERNALLGGHIAFWTKRAVQSGLYRDAMHLLAGGWPMIITAVAHRCSVILTGRRPIESLAL
jgi:glycosyltransferase involved in cell wall biosynthesis